MGFDRAAWASGKGNFDGENPRSQMIEDARAAGLVIGAMRKDVRALLGDPDGSGENVDIYYTGRTMFTPDTSSLYVKYDASGRVAAINEKRT